MIDYPEGIPGYVIGKVEVSNAFPVNRRGDVDLCCEHCRFYVLRSRRCFLTDELQHYPERDIGIFCPLLDENGKPLKST